MVYSHSLLTSLALFFPGGPVVIEQGPVTQPDELKPGEVLVKVGFITNLIPDPLILFPPLTHNRCSDRSSTQASAIPVNTNPNNFSLMVLMLLP